MKRAPAAVCMALVLAQACTQSSPTPRPSAPSPTLPSSTPPLSVVASVTCTDTGTRVETPATVAQPDGIHFYVHNASSATVAFVVGAFGELDGREHQTLPDGRTLVFGRFLGSDEPDHDNSVAPGRSEMQVWGIPPGSAGVACIERGTSVRVLSGVKALTVVDPQGRYVSTQLSCADAFSYEITLPEDVTDPVTNLRNQIRGLEPNDILERAEYPQQAMVIIRIVRGSRTVGVAYGGFPRGLLSVCRDTIIRPAGVPAPPSPSG